MIIHSTINDFWKSTNIQLVSGTSVSGTTGTIALRLDSVKALKWRNRWERCFILFNSHVTSRIDAIWLWGMSIVLIFLSFISFIQCSDCLPKLIAPWVRYEQRVQWSNQRKSCGWQNCSFFGQTSWCDVRTYCSHQPSTVNICGLLECEYHTVTAHK